MLNKTSPRPLAFSPCLVDLSLVDYEATYVLQKKNVEEVIAGRPERVLLCEHPAVLTLGRMADESFILISKEELALRGIKVLAIDRGGEVTLHAPGQLVVYPILDLTRRGKDLRAYIRRLEEAAIEFLRSFEITAGRVPGKTGVWVGSQKIVSIGVGVKKWVTFHGMAINMNMDLSLFSLIKPCGLDVAMTSMARIKGRAINSQIAKQRFAEVFLRYFP